MKTISIWTAISAMAALLTGCGGSESAPSSPPEPGLGSIDAAVDTQIQILVREGRIPSLAAGIVVGDELVWAQGYGEQTSLTTVYMVGSINKTFIATAIFQLYERGILDLDDDASAYLPFQVRHPAYPDVPVTIRMLLTHTSGLIHDLPNAAYYDNDDRMLQWMTKNAGIKVDESVYDRFPTRDEYLASFFEPDDSAEAAEIWKTRPSTTYSYSNLGFHDLLGKVVEGATGQSKYDFIQANIFDPLDLDRTSFFASHFAEHELAVPHVRRESGYKELPLTGMSASGPLRTTVPDLARFMMVPMSHGAIVDVQILQPATVELMLSRAVSLSGYDFNNLNLYGMGLGWQLWGDGLQGHGGAVPGFLSEIIFQQAEPDAYGVVIMMNVGCSIGVCDRDWLDAHFYAIRDILLAEASAYASP